MKARFTDTDSYIYSRVIVSMFLVGCFTQFIALRIFTKKTFMKKPLNALFINLVIASLIFILLEFPLSLVSLFKSSLVLGQLGCTIRGFLSGTAAIAIIFTFYAITIKITELVHMKSKFNCLARLHDSCLVIIIWGFSGVCMAPPLFGVCTITVEPGGLNCAPDWSANGFKDRSYVIILMVFAYILPVALLVYNFINLWKDVYQMKKIYPVGHIARKIRFRVMIKLIVILSSIFTILWLPYCVYCFIALAGKAHWYNNSVIALIPPLIGKSSSIYIPITYFLISRRFRLECFRIVCIKRKRQAQE